MISHTGRMMAVEPGSRYAHPPRRRSPRIAAVLLPATAAIALLRLLARSLARSLLALPGAALDVALFAKTFGAVAGGWLACRLLLFHHFGPGERTGEFAWLWGEARLLFAFPRLLDDAWRRWLGGYVPSSRTSIVKSLLLLTLVWATGLHLAIALLRAVRVGFSPDGRTPLPWPKPRLRAPLPFGFIANAAAFSLRLCIPAALLLALPPGLRPFWRWYRPVSPLDAVPGLWPLLDRLVYPRPLDARMRGLLARHGQDARRQGVFSPALHWNRSILEMAGIEIGVLAVGLAALWSAAWLLASWRRAAGGSSEFAAPSPSGPARRRRTPGWAIVLLPVTVPLALAGLTFWKSPLWLPRLAVTVVLVYAAGFAGTFVFFWYGAAHHGGTDYEAMRWLRRTWLLLERQLRYPRWWREPFLALPHRKGDRIGDGALFHGILLLSAVAALAVVPALFIVFAALAAGKRTLEALAR